MGVACIGHTHIHVRKHPIDHNLNNSRNAGRILKTERTLITTCSRQDQEQTDVARPRHGDGNKLHGSSWIDPQEIAPLFSNQNQTGELILFLDL